MTAEPSALASQINVQHLPITPETLLNAALFAGIAIAFAVIAAIVRPYRRGGFIGLALVAVVVVLLLWTVSQLGSTLAGGTLFDILREILLALLAFAVLRSTLLFVSRVLLARLEVPHIVADVLLTLGLVAFALYRLSVIGVNLAGIVTTSAVITGAIAFSAQEVLGALWAGLALQAERTVRQGDWIRYGDKLGQIVQMRWRTTAIATCDHETIIIPNAALMKDKITLVGRHGDDSSLLRRHIAFSVGYGHSPGQVVHAVNHAFHAAEISNVARVPVPFCVCKAFEDSGIAYEVLYHIVDLHHYPTTDSAMLGHVFAALKRHGMTIPFPHRVVQVQRDVEGHAARHELEQRLAVIRDVSLFAPLNEDERAHLAAELESWPFAGESLVCRQGDEADSLFVLARGKLGVFHEDSHGARQKLAELDAPAYFGEMGLLLGQPRAATIIAQTEALCYRVRRHSFDAILRNRPQIIEGLSRALAERQAQNDSRLKALDAEGRARTTTSQAAEFMRIIRTFFGLAGGVSPQVHGTSSETHGIG